MIDIIAQLVTVWFFGGLIAFAFYGVTNIPAKYILIWPWQIAMTLGYTVHRVFFR